MFLLIQEADLAVAPLTITHARSKVVDFTKPYQDLGMTILMAKEADNSHAVAFLSPFNTELWIVLTVTLGAVGLFLTCLR